MPALTLEDFACLSENQLLNGTLDRGFAIQNLTGFLNTTISRAGTLTDTGLGGSTLIRREFPRLLGVTSDLPFTVPINVYKQGWGPGLHTRDISLRTGVPEVPFLSLRNIPHLKFASAYSHHSTYIFFPHLAVTDASTMMAQYYIQVLLPSLRPFEQDVSEAESLSYYLARGASPGLVKVNATELDALIKELRKFIGQSQGLDALRSFFFMHEFIDASGITRHLVPCETLNASHALELLIPPGSFSIVHAEKWFIDVKITISREGYTVLWKKESHGDLLGLIVASLGDIQLTDLPHITQDLDVYSDLHFPEFGGFRWTAPPGRYPVVIEALNVKSKIHEGRHDGGMRLREPVELLYPGGNGLMLDIAANEERYRKPDATYRSGVATLLSRQPLSLLHSCSLEFEQLALCTASLDTMHLWKFTALRAHAVNVMLKHLHTIPPKLRSTRSCLAFGASLIALYNAMHQEQHLSNTETKKLLKYVRRREPGLESSLDVFFLQEITEDGNGFVGDFYGLSDKEMAWMYSCENFSTLESCLA
ncbi:hypothetical protein C8J56DRAFT_1066732 [Mycena floridula]|nr:hypothetical protein C8J56DRAFT_1066732 [Mycena floridula]